MNKLGIDQDALVKQFSQASAKQGEALRQAVEQATLKALQGRELTVRSIREVLKAMTQAASAGAARSGLAAPDIEALLAKAVDGMDAALVKAVEAQRRALQQVVDQGVALRETQLKKVVSEIEKMEDLFFTTLQKATADAGDGIAQPWAQALDGMKRKGSATGSSATAAIEQLSGRAREAAREGRALGQKAAEAWMDHYAALANGVLIGMTEALGAGGASSADTGTPRPRGKR